MTTTSPLISNFPNEFSLHSLNNQNPVLFENKLRLFIWALITSCVLAKKLYLHQEYIHDSLIQLNFNSSISDELPWSGGNMGINIA